MTKELTTGQGNCQCAHGYHLVIGQAFSLIGKATTLLRTGALAIALCLLSLPVATAADISFRLSKLPGKLTVTLQGDASAYYPVALRMMPDGRWNPLPPVTGSRIPVELTPNTSFDVEWPDTGSSKDPSPLERLQPVMVRFFEQDGVSLGQIAFFHEPATASQTLPAEYIDGSLLIDPAQIGRENKDRPEKIHASWILWPQEDGVAPLGSAVHFEHHQPAALHIDWRTVSGKLKVDTGQGQPDALLLHETTQGLAIQRIAGTTTSRQPLPAWINASSLFYRLAILLAVVALLVLLSNLVRSRRRQTRD